MRQLLASVLACLYVRTVSSPPTPHPKQATEIERNGMMGNETVWHYDRFRKMAIGEGVMGRVRM